MNTQENYQIEEAEIIEPVGNRKEIVALDKSVSITPKQLQSQVKRDEEIREIVNGYIKNNMEEGKDYGSIDVRGKISKPSLFKPGGEKFCSLFKLKPAFVKDVETLEMINIPNVIAYKCLLIDSKGQVVGEGRGATQIESVSDFNINKGIKIAEKRAQIDAVLRTGGLSDFFTQDTEDMPIQERQASNPTNKYASNLPNHPKPVAKSNNPISPAQKALIQKLADERDMNIQNIDSLSSSEASEKIQELFKLPKKEANNG